MTSRSSSSSSSFPRLTTDLAAVRRAIIDSVTVGDERARGPFEHFTRRPGRLFRPTLALTSAYVVDHQVSAEEVIPAAVTVELLHLATLCHDDLCDRAETRRGHPTVNALFGDATALISGDYLLACATGTAASLGTLPMQLIGETLKTICMGQLQEGLDLYDVDRSESAYFAAITGKTAALMEASAVLGAAAAGGDAVARAGMGSFGRNLGIAFQIWDDVLDIWAPNGVTGKESGQDLANGVYTLPVIYALRERPAELQPLLSKGEFTPQRREEILAVLGRTDAAEQSLRVARAHIEQALSDVRSLPGVAPDSAERLIAVARLLMPEIDRLLPRPEHVETSVVA
ncbi:geranylgeranyl pyrophosphate synthase [Actinoalloteichus sp. GBA129-24]|uniref:Geranylgeranyl pyrophosphate synthase n=1 Tax=Actinoalloteichus fjordicus TaxID=1612552 RepID=A0AAC9LE45_9PSEU|nr:geranylgeranyl pyrophosphate synthase [Actinoalloteichus fjordicus]APU20577.1 geranylgeranyl pyrophosphate synthase [Actinoalloteichus sp. GBA129-24]